MWNGTVAFGEVIFPVKLYSIVQERRVRFREVHLADGGKIVHRRSISSSEGSVRVASQRMTVARLTAISAASRSCVQTTRNRSA